ncbi:D-alanyl-D-alanine carboxypeptidase family protein [Arthrobacter burdickii]|uniref:D-alanyl-D-alanine carboxypeptidase family protein n=1 Tax=Arthrobacter burdickii TaxID=3035920 RepID=A0ABT8K1A1_9MICC|nr:D-alanyl-D-alanine carboxypeptidase family protein [Arthrobacter burdickii]MDN4610798.1 D-alanyl-D-alanine carboxypeptidase family protein [Arthrobacter burdickii]
MRVVPCAVLVLLALGLPACSAPGPAGTAASAAATQDPSPTGSPAPAGDLPAPAQREPAPVSTESAEASARPSSPPPDLHSDPGAVDVVVNKRRPLVPLDYAPTGLRLPEVATAGDTLLRSDTAVAVEEMFAAAEDDGVGLVLLSGYRSFADQESTYAHWVDEYGDAAAADTVSARPGYSEHQTGLAFDIGQADGACSLVLCFRDTAAARWTAEHAADFGFLLRYPLGFHGITGFSAESWHFRYVGRDVSLVMKAAGTRTLEEHLGLPAAPSY